MKDLTKRNAEEFNEALAKNMNSNNIYFKLHKAKLEIGKVTKGSKNPFFKSNYADLNSLIEAVEPTLLKYDLILLQPVKDGNVYTQIIDIESGDMVESSLPLPSITDPQKIIASITYFRRGTLQSLLSLQAIDDDGNEAAKTATKLKTISDADFERGINKMEVGAFKELMKGYKLTGKQEVKRY
jgi:hypothetical protein